MPSNPLADRLSVIIRDVKMLLVCAVDSSLNSSSNIRQTFVRGQRVHDHEVLAIQDAELAEMRDQSVEVSRLHEQTPPWRPGRTSSPRQR